MGKIHRVLEIPREWKVTIGSAGADCGPARFIKIIVISNAMNQDAHNPAAVRFSPWGDYVLSPIKRSGFTLDHFQ